MTKRRGSGNRGGRANSKKRKNHWEWVKGRVMGVRQKAKEQAGAFMSRKRT